MKTLFSFLIPGAGIFLAAIGFLRPHGLPGWVQGPVSALPYIVLAFGLVFGWYLASGRLILSLLVLGLADRGLALFPLTDSDPASAGHTIFVATSFLLPLNLLALSLVKEEAFSTWRGLMRLPFVLIQPFFVLWFSSPDYADLAASLQRPLLSMLRTDWSMIPQPALLAFVGALVLTGARFALERNPLDAGAFWGVLTSFVAFQGVSVGWSSTNFFSAAGLILFVTLVQSSHQQSYRDLLTGIPGKLAYTETVANLRGRYVVAIAGIDQLKQYGNQHGKPVSEQLLRLIAPKIQSSAGQGMVFRLAGEEFTILFFKKSATETLVALEAIRKAVEHTTLYLGVGGRVWKGVPRGSQQELTVTVSIGVAEASDSRTPIGLVTKAAYRALYEAKAEGGNLVKRGNVLVDPPKAARSETGRIVSYSEFEA